MRLSVPNEIGFTGTRSKLTKIQIIRIAQLLWKYRTAQVPLSERSENRFHHGCCQGADEIGATIASGLEYVIIGHPPTNPTYLMSKMYLNDFREQPAHYLERDRNIVDVTDLLIATPDSHRPRPHSGTWYTIKYAKLKTKPFLVVTPDGTIHEDFSLV